jgi:arabinogalactan oligomer / maltooligosaccharide transport system permease protein
MTNPFSGGLDASNVKRKSVKQLYDGGTPSLRGTIIKIVLLALLDAVTIFVAFVLFMREQWLPVAVAIIGMLIVNWLYLRRGGLPAKYLAPGVILLIAFQVYVLFFSAYTAFTNYGSYHNGDQNLAVSAIKAAGFGPVEGAPQYDVKLVQDDKGRYNFMLTDAFNGKVLVGGSAVPLTEIPACSQAISEVIATNATTVAEADCKIEILADNIAIAVSAPGYTEATQAGLSKGQTNSLAALRLYLDPNDTQGQFIKTEDLMVAVTNQEELIWNEEEKSFLRVTDGVVFNEAVDGYFRAGGAPDGEKVSDIGWRVEIGFKNFEKIFTDEDLRQPLLKIISWTFIFAALSVLTTFIAGLAIALLFNDDRMRGKRVYRALMILPYAFPAFLSAYVWRGLLDTDNGFVNNAILGGAEIPWLTEEFPARVAVLLVNLWLGFPYMFLITTGALQAIPAELTESATIDGATPWQILRQIKMPLLLVTIAPLLIASFAFNFNNFTLIYLLTEGGPLDSASSGYDAGGTDILITFVYKIAFSSGGGQDYGLASAFSILIFIIVATFSLISFRRTRTLEDVN